jgi:hypothetical protein
MKKTLKLPLNAPRIAQNPGLFMETCSNKFKIYRVDLHPGKANQSRNDIANIHNMFESANYSANYFLDIKKAASQNDRRYWVVSCQTGLAGWSWGELNPAKFGH